MSEFECKECGKTFTSRRGLHQHTKCHFDSLAEYYVKHHPRYDLFSKEPIPFKKYSQYVDTDFVSYENYLKWIKVSPSSEVKEYIIKKFKQKAEHKELGFMPPNAFYDLYEMPNIMTMRNVWGSYNAFCKEIGLPVKLNKKLPESFWSNDASDITVMVDTREQLPFSYKNSISQKLDFGDYTAAGEDFSKTFVDRKSVGDFRSTFGKDIDRFRREMDRCVEFDSYMFVVVEDSIQGVKEANKKTKFKSNLNYVWHNVRDLMIEYPDNLQFIFAYSRNGAKKITPKILKHGQALWKVDLQYYIENRVCGKQRVSMKR
jgi:hypothetical protein